MHQHHFISYKKCESHSDLEIIAIRLSVALETRVKSTTTFTSKLD